MNALLSSWFDFDYGSSEKLGVYLKLAIASSNVS